ncbi:MAG TPA: hypothetical protein PKC98_07730, partial [Candidatus Melainabacteria bacterium]|nr:hypothetical protein [Candidatus Melainabacteria bacterium]
MNGYQIVIQLEKNCTVEAIQAAQNWLEYNCKDLIVPCIVDLIYRHDNTGSIEKWLICWAEKCNDFFSIFSVLKTTKSLESIDLAKTYLRELSSCSPRTVEIVKLLLQNCRDSETIQICETWLFENWFDLGAGEVLETLVSIRGTTIYETRLTESNCEEDSAGMILVFIKHMLSRKLEEVSLKYIEKHPGTINSALILAELIKKKADIDIVRAVKFQISQSNIKEKGKQVPIILESFSNENRPGEYFLSLAKKHAGFGLKPKSFTAIRLLLEFSEKSDTENWLRKWIVLNANDSITPRLLRILVEQRDCEEILGLASWWLQLSD